MKQHPEIVNELQDIAPTLASLQGRGCPFVIPVGEKKDFEKVDWQKLAEQKEYETILGNKVGAWAVPENYWQSLEQELMSKIAATENPSIESQDFPLAASFTTPDNYFQNFTEIVLEKVTVGDFAIKHEKSFQTPAGYFDELETQIFDKIKAAEKSSPKKTTLIIQWRRIAVAAVLAGVIFSAIWFLKSSNTSIGIKPIEATAMNEQQVQEYVQEQASEAEIQNMVEANDLETAQEEELQQLLTKPEEQKTENKKAVVEEYISNEIDESTLTELL